MYKCLKQTAQDCSKMALSISPEEVQLSLKEKIYKAEEKDIGRKVKAHASPAKFSSSVLFCTIRNRQRKAKSGKG